MKGLAWFALGVIVGMALGCGSRTEVPQGEVVRCDTLSRVDTVRVVLPVPVRSTEVRRDTVWLPSVRTDTVVVRDSALVVVPIEQRVYTDTTYTAWVSGYRPSLDSIEVYRRTVEVTRTLERWRTRRWGVGVTAGYGWTPDGFRPYVGVGISYTIIGF